MLGLNKHSIVDRAGIIQNWWSKPISHTNTNY
jgi:hypothetical protein